MKTPEIPKEEKAKQEKIRTRIEIFEKQLPMRKMTITEWVKLVKAGQDEEVTTIAPERLLQALRSMKIWKTEKILDEGTVFTNILR